MPNQFFKTIFLMVTLSALAACGGNNTKPTGPRGYSTVKAPRDYSSPRQRNAIARYNSRNYRVGKQWEKRRLYREALRFHLLDLTSQKSRHGDNHVLTAYARLNVARAYSRIGKYELAKKHAIKAATALSNQMGHANVEVADAYSLIARISMGLGQVSESLYYVNAAIKFRVLSTRKNNVALAMDYLLKAAVMSASRRLAESDKFMIKAARLFKSELGERDPKLILMYTVIGRTFLMQQSLDRALHFFTRAEKISKSMYGANHFSVGIMQEFIGVTYARMENYDRAVTHYRISLRIIQDSPYDNRARLARIYMLLASAYYAKSQYAQAEQYQKKALFYAQTIWGKDHPRTRLMRRLLDRIQIKTKPL